jgi:uncharacterized membrane protein YfcA
VPLRTDLGLFLAGLLASSVNAAAGGGTLLSFPSLMAAGLPPIAANATSTVGLLTGYFASVAGYRAEMRRLRGEVIFAIIPSILGGSVGAWLLIRLGAAIFAKIVPGLLLIAAFLLLAQPLLSAVLRKAPRIDRPVPLFIALLIVALYAGYFGAGAGILFLAAMGLMYGRDLGQVNAIKVFVSLLANVIAAVTFLVLELLHPTGTLSFRAVVPLAIGALAGGYLGVRIARRLPPNALRAFAAAVGLGIAVYFLVFRHR